VLVPSIVGLDEERARTALEQAGFDGSITVDEEESLAEAGTVATVTPEEGQPVAPDGSITLGISTGSVDVPDVLGRTEADARGVLTAAGFSAAQLSTEQVDADRPAGTVVATTPGGGSAASADTRIVLQVSSGPAEPTTLPVPSIPAGAPAASAYDQLVRAGFQNIAVLDEAGDEASPADTTVVRTDPPAQTQLEPADRLVLVVQPASTDAPAAN
jgi:serine/threonine-protein kinase